MRGALKEEVTNRFPWLFDDLGFHITAHDFSYKAMRSSFVVLESSALRARFENDGRSIHVEIASLAEPERWMEMGLLWQSLTGDQPSPQLDGWAWFLRDHLPQLKEALGPDFEKTKAAFEEQAKEARETFERAVAPYRRSARAGHLKAIIRGPMGWAIAVVLLIWIAARGTF
jgi:hypothetical protein